VISITAKSVAPDDVFSVSQGLSKQSDGTKRAKKQRKKQKRKIIRQQTESALPPRISSRPESQKPKSVDAKLISTAALKSDPGTKVSNECPP